MTKKEAWIVCAIIWTETLHEISFDIINLFSLFSPRLIERITISFILNNSFISIRNIE